MKKNKGGNPLQYPKQGPMKRKTMRFPVSMLDFLKLKGAKWLRCLIQKEMDK